jgi:uncharacterized membrane protein
MPSPYDRNPKSSAAIARHTIRKVLASFPIACFTLVLVTDIAYWRTSNLMWLEFSAWLLLAGITLGVVAALFGAISFLIRFGFGAVRFGWPAAVGTIIVLILAFFNNLVHTADGWTAVIPWGLTLSVLTVLAMFVTVWLGTSLVHNHSVGVRSYD